MKTKDEVRTSNICSICEQHRREECGRIECGNRPRQVTANVPGGSVINFYGSGYHRRTKLDEN